MDARLSVLVRVATDEVDDHDLDKVGDEAVGLVPVAEAAAAGPATGAVVLVAAVAVATDDEDDWEDDGMAMPQPITLVVSTPLSLQLTSGQALPAVAGFVWHRADALPPMVATPFSAAEASLNNRVVPAPPPELFADAGGLSSAMVVAVTMLWGFPEGGGGGGALTFLRESLKPVAQLFVVVAAVASLMTWSLLLLFCETLATEPEILAAGSAPTPPHRGLQLLVFS